METVVMSREDQLVAAVIMLGRLRDSWRDSGAQRITNAFAEAMDDLIFLYEEGDIPAECRLLFNLYPALKEGWTKFVDEASERIREPGKGFWDALRAMEDLLYRHTDDFEVPPLESVLELSEQSSPNAGPPTWTQIAYMYAYKGVGPFMKNKKPMPHLVIQQCKFEKARAKCRRMEDGSIDKRDLDRLLQTEFVGGKQIIADNWERPEVKAFRDAGRRVEMRLVERAAKLRGMNGYSGAAESAEETGTGTGNDGLPLTRAQMDALEAGGTLPEPSVAVESLPESSDDPAEQRMIEADQAEMRANVYRLLDQNPNVSNRDIAEGLGISVKEVQKIRQGRDKA